MEYLLLTLLRIVRLYSFNNSFTCSRLLLETNFLMCFCSIIKSLVNGIKDNKLLALSFLTITNVFVMFVFAKSSRSLIKPLNFSTFALLASLINVVAYKIISSIIENPFLMFFRISSVLFSVSIRVAIISNCSSRVSSP